ncbi:putative disease resistance protein [Cardamine amara subsp. amara]|uniref:Disease resistance protein n=1 Tax=Cardamine amara subsp. amara TaxID=228776 RepID=A0ABD1A206_CARAN
MAEAFLVLGVDKLLDLLVRESDRFKGVDEQLNEIKRDLKFFSKFLKDADAKKHSLESVINCVAEIKEVVLDTEDIIETFILKEQLSKTSGIKERMRRLSCIIVDRMELASDMERISKRISKVIDYMKTIGVPQMIVESGEYSHPLQVRQREMRRTFPVVNNENDLVGLEENVKKLVGYLVEENSIRVVSITGMGGIGKTTLARQVFNHEMVKNHFDGVVWVCISQQFSRKDVWQTILKKLSSNYDEQRDSKMKEEEIQDKLRQLFETSKYLIVLDDMWKEEDWDRIEPALPSNKGYWKVLLTSRYESVGLHADSNCVTFKPNYLTSEESWTLFQSITFPSKDTSEIKIDVEMEEMGKEMIKHCGGLPLVVKVLGGLLVGKHTLSEWKRVCENIGSLTIGGTSFNGRNLSSVYHILYLSFEELPFNLKQCFLYLAHFPEDCEINVEKLSYYWAAEAIPRPRGYDVATVREVAERYIEELVQRNMVISQRDAITSRFETCQLHDMMREVCVRKAKEENFVDIVDVANSQSPRNSRRIAYTLGYDEEKSFDPKGMMKNPKLRSLMFFGLEKWMISVLSLFLSFIADNCLIFPMFGNWMTWDLLFARLQLLRVLDLSDAKFRRGKLPSSIGKLIHLRYLSLYGAYVSYLPSSMRNLKQLLYLNLVVYINSPVYIPNNVLNEMRELIYISLPFHIHDKVKMELGNLVNLETLGNFSTKHSSVRDLQQMTKLETLSIKFNGGCTMETLSSSLSELSRLKNLTIRCWEEVQIPILEKLLHLHEVILSYGSFSGKRMVCSRGGFPQLQKLTLSWLEEWEEWIVEEGSMPLLHTLSIWTCKKLKELPDGLRFITSLKELKIFRATLEFKEKLSEGGEDFYKVQHIPLLKIE